MNPRVSIERSLGTTDLKSFVIRLEGIVITHSGY